MLKWVIQKILGTHNAREIKRLWPVAEQVNRLEPSIQSLSDAQLRAKTDEFRARLRASREASPLMQPATAAWYALNHDERERLKIQRRARQHAALGEILPEAFAVVREAARRTVQMRHFDMQLVGGAVLHEGKIAEMATGEGKTLVATLPAYLNALTGRGVHVVTVNDYLARRDTRWMGPIYHALGLSVGVIQGVDPAERRPGEESLSFLYDPAWTQASERFVQLRPIARREAYAADITYGQNNEFGFDYLRDNMRFRQEDLVQREFQYAIVDEVDSILIDEARTPLIISGPAEESTELYVQLDGVVQHLAKGTDYEVDEKQHAVSLTEAGIKHGEELLHVDNLYDEAHMRLVHHLNQALRAHELFRLDVDYMVKDHEIIIVDEFTGRLMPGRRWSDGLHQAIEAKEGVRIREENQTLASVTFQNYFRMYEKLAGMTGTASTEASEFSEIYKLDVLTVPTNRPLIRRNDADTVYRTEGEKFLAVVQEIVDLHRRGQPVLVGTISIEKSERLSRLLKEPGPVITRLGTVCQWAVAEAKQESVPEELKQRLLALLARPAMITAEDAEALFEQLKRQAPKSVLVYRVEEIARLARTITAIRAGVPHNVLNAKYHEQEAHIVAQAGRLGRVTIATNMAGRGTDVLLGGNAQFLAEDAIREQEAAKGEPLALEERASIVERFRAVAQDEHHQVVALGGLHMLGTERHEARRIDNQLRGRAGRQGDPGSSRFYLALEDDLMRIFGSDRIAKLMDFKWFKWEEGLPIEHPWVSRSIETAQRRVEGQNFEARKHLLEYDNVMNRQREVIYEQRRRILEGVELKRLVEDIVAEVAEELVEVYAPKEQRSDAWDLESLRAICARQFGVEVPAEAPMDSRDAMHEQLVTHLTQAYQAKEQGIGADVMRQLERSILLAVMDAKWKDHLYMMDALREGIGLRAYGQRDPLVEYQHEAYAMFRQMIATIKADSLAMLLRVQPTPTAVGAVPVSVFARTPQRELHADAPTISQQSAVMEHAPIHTAPSPSAARRQPQPAPWDPRGPSEVPRTQRGAGGAVTTYQPGPKVGRNDPCHCGSGVKFKKCHGK